MIRTCGWGVGTCGWGVARTAALLSPAAVRLISEYCAEGSGPLGSLQDGNCRHNFAPLQLRMRKRRTHCARRQRRHGDTPLSKGAGEFPPTSNSSSSNRVTAAFPGTEATGRVCLTVT